MDFDIPRGVIVPVSDVDVALDPAPHPFEGAHRAAIDANWLAEKGANPSLFDGEVSLLARLAYRDGRLEGACHAIRFATFLYWRKTRSWPGAEHCFAHAVPVTSDGALIAIRMGPRTAAPGKVYFAAGSFDPQDFPDGKVDVDFNMAREVAEETGLDIAGLPRDPHYHALSGANGTVIVRRYFLPQPAEAVAAAIRAFVAADPDPEIEEPVIIRSADDPPEGIMPYMGTLVAWHFGGGGAEKR
jgi:8-oxo-dGTP pyrophosphatase MutT (NUDIX family)